MFFLILCLLQLSCISSNNIITLYDNNLVNIRGKINSISVNNFAIDTNKINTTKEIFLYINSPGGSVMDGFAMIEQIKMLKLENITVSCIGDFSASMAFAILQFCSNRYALFSSVLMQHQMSLKLNGNLYGLDSYMNMIRDINTYLDEEQASRINITMDNFIKKISVDWWISGISAVKENVVDQIISIRCNKSLYALNETIEHITFFGSINVVYSKCPLIKYPLDIILPKGVLMDEEILSIIDIDNMKKTKQYYSTY